MANDKIIYSIITQCPSNTSDTLLTWFHGLVYPNSHTFLSAIMVVLKFPKKIFMFVFWSFLFVGFVFSCLVAFYKGSEKILH